MAIENTLAGSLLANYDLLQRSDLRITGEVYLRIRQNLMALPGVAINELREVYSHPIALMQVREFFKTYPQIKLVESADTALSARDVRDTQDRTRGAVAHHLAAELYELDILASGIETNRLNHTRFLVLERGRETKGDTGDKVSMSFSVSHESGSLARVLSVLNAYKINLTKIQSTPIIGRPWQYRFYVDFELHSAITLSEALAGIGPITQELRVQGIYTAGEKPDA
jgi:prephenate dehydratase